MSREIGLTKVHAVAGILLRNGKMLIAERPPGKPYSGYWEFPGGKIEAQESGKAALHRELQEELGIEITAAKHLFDHTYQYPDKTVLLEVWLVKEFTGEPQGQENQQLRWIALYEAANVRLLEGNWTILDKLESWFSE